jgi:hypothetical protein
VPDEGDGIDARSIEAKRVTGRILPACATSCPERRLDDRAGL